MYSAVLIPRFRGSAGTSAQDLIGLRSTDAVQAGAVNCGDRPAGDAGAGACSDGPTFVHGSAVASTLPAPVSPIDPSAPDVGRPGPGSSGTHNSSISWLTRAAYRHANASLLRSLNQVWFKYLVIGEDEDGLAVTDATREPLAAAVRAAVAREQLRGPSTPIENAARANLTAFRTCVFRTSIFWWT
jgi:hypothetical protein